MRKIIKIFQGREFSKISGFHERVLVSVDNDVIASFAGVTSASVYADGLHDAFVCEGYSVDVVCEIPINSY